MKYFFLFTLFLMESVLFLDAIDSKTRQQPLSDEEPGSPEYDHEAFLGKDMAAEYEQFSPEETKQKLGELFGKIDSNGNGLMSGEELKNWIIKARDESSLKARQEDFSSHDINNDQALTWKEHEETVRKMNPELTSEDNEGLENDKFKFKFADRDSNGRLTADEYHAFVNPEGYQHMRDWIAYEQLHFVDQDKSGSVDLDEYLSALHGENDEPGEKQLDEEREKFKTAYDKDGNGKLEKREIADWVLSYRDLVVDEEANHLMAEADQNKDGSISKDEMLEHHDIFAGSAVTDYGQIWARDEL